MTKLEIEQFLDKKDKTLFEINKFKDVLIDYGKNESNYLDLLMDSNDGLFLHCMPYIDFKFKDSRGFNLVGQLILKSRGDLLDGVFKYIKENKIPYSEWGGDNVVVPRSFKNELPGVLTALLISQPSFASSVLLAIPDEIELYNCKKILNLFKENFFTQLIWLAKTVRANANIFDNCSNNLCRFLFVMAESGAAKSLDLNSGIQEEWFDKTLSYIESQALTKDNKSLSLRSGSGIKL